MSNRLSPLSSTNARDCELVFRMVQQQMGFVPNSLLTMARQPAVLGSLAILIANIRGPPSDGRLPIWRGVRLYFKNMLWTIRHSRSAERLPASLRSMVAHATSNASGCRYCQAHTIGGAFHHGTSIEKIEAVWDFENSDLFDAAEIVALRFAFAAGSSPSAVTDEHFIALRLHYSEQQIVELGAVISLFGFLNRWNDTFATTLEPNAAAFAHKHLAHSGWKIGKHG